MPKSSTVSDKQMEKLFERFRRKIRSSPITPAQMHAVLARRTDALEDALLGLLNDEVFEATQTDTFRFRYDITTDNLERMVRESVIGDLRLGGFNLDHLSNETPRGAIVKIDSVEMDRNFTINGLFAVCRDGMVDPVMAISWAVKYLKKTTPGARFVAGWRDRYGELWVVEISWHSVVVQKVRQWPPRKQPLMFPGRLAKDLCTRVLVRDVSVSIFYL